LSGPSSTLDAPQLAALLDALPTAVVATAPGTGEVLAANAAFCTLVARGQDEVLGVRPPYPWLVEGARPESGSATATYRRADGATVPVGLELRHAAAPNGSPGAVVCTVTELSAARRLDAQIVQSGRLAAVGELAAGVAHEVNNPLFAILGLTEFLAREATPGSKAAERLELIRQSGEEIKGIVQALLDFARENPQERQVVPLAQVVRQTMTLVRRTNAHKGVEFMPTYDASNAAVWGSPNQLKQVFLNLIANARQAMTSGGTVQIDVRRDGSHVVATVADDGPGIPDELAERIFEPFFTTRGAGVGTGLGLSVSHGIATAHGGTLELDRSRRHGATFVLRLPVAEEGRA
jgi:signal transduction histidine kinase